MSASLSAQIAAPPLLSASASLPGPIPAPPPLLPPTPRVHVALAARNGKPWIAAQVDSILNQRGVSVRLVVSDDQSTDGTRQWLQDLAARNHRVTLLPARNGKPSVAGNFWYALAETRMQPGEYFAFADQDDLWHENKLAEQIAFMRATRADAVSSNAFLFGDGHPRTVIRRDYPQRKWDYLFEAPGPGATFVLGFPAYQLVRNYASSSGPAGIEFHDWFIYALVRAAGLTWAIDPRPHLAYRQHSGNYLGARRGMRGFWLRFRKLRSGFYREQFILTATNALQCGIANGRDRVWRRELEAICTWLQRTDLRARLALGARFWQLRRRPCEGALLALALLLKIW